MAAPVIQLRVPEETLARIDAVRGGDTRSAWLQRLIDRELAGQDLGLTVVRFPLHGFSRAGLPGSPQRRRVPLPPLPVAQVGRLPRGADNRPTGRWSCG